MELFSQTPVPGHEPLAYRMRPRNLDEYAGQDHIIGKGRLLRRVIQADQLSSLIFYGPPGTGKTTLARVIANSTKSYFITLNAVLSGVQQLREAMASAQEKRDLQGRRTTLFIDEVHRWNKAQQDALLPWVENGTIILIGATTANPYFEVNPALVSRSRIFQLKPLTREDLRQIALQALGDPERGYGKFQVRFDEKALEHLIDVANGDARSLLNALELAVETTPGKYPPPPGTTIEITLETAEESIQKKALLYDKEGDYHYDTISAFIKSIRGSDPDAALYWMARMLRAGEDPRFLFRRMLISASEDVGMADPQALGVVDAAASAFERVGLPEGNFHLTQAALYLATAPKSNSALGFFDAAAVVDQEYASEVPSHLRDASRDKKGFGHGEGYLYPHAYRDHWVAQQYLPRGLQGRIFYQPSPTGYEKDIAGQVARRRELQLESALETPPPEVLTFSPSNRQKEEWLKRSTAAQSENLKIQRDEILKDIVFNRNDRVLVPFSGSGLLVWEALRQVPEGGVYVLTENPEEAALVNSLGEKLSREDRPQVILSLDSPDLPGFEKILGRQVLSSRKNQKERLSRLFALTAPGGILSLGEIIPRFSPRLSELLIRAETDAGKTEKFIPALDAAEKVLYEDPESSAGWLPEELTALAEAAGFDTAAGRVEPLEETVRLSGEILEGWLSPDGAGYGQILKNLLTPREQEELTLLLKETLTGRDLPWPRKILYLRAARG